MAQVTWAFNVFCLCRDPKPVTTLVWPCFVRPGPKFRVWCAPCQLSRRVVQAVALALALALAIALALALALALAIALALALAHAHAYAADRSMIALPESTGLEVLGTGKKRNSGRWDAVALPKFDSECDAS